MSLWRSQAIQVRATRLGLQLSTIASYYEQICQEILDCLEVTRYQTIAWILRHCKFGGAMLRVASKCVASLHIAEHEFTFPRWKAWLIGISARPVLKPGRALPWPGVQVMY